MYLVKTTKCQARGEICQILFGNWSFLFLALRVLLGVSLNGGKEESNNFVYRFVTEQ